MKPVYLSGFMGCGKSYSGKRAAKEFNLHLVDLDEYITEREGVKIPHIFEKRGEKFFRNLEFEALQEVSADIISLGGGALTNPDTAAYAKKYAVIIFMNTPFDTCYERIKIDGFNKRSLASKKSKEELFALYKSRESVYKSTADYIIGNQDELAYLIEKLIKERNNDENL